MYLRSPSSTKSTKTLPRVNLAVLHASLWISPTTTMGMISLVAPNVQELTKHLSLIQMKKIVRQPAIVQINSVSTKLVISFYSDPWYESQEQASCSRHLELSTFPDLKTGLEEGYEDHVKEKQGHLKLLVIQRISPLFVVLIKVFKVAQAITMRR